MQIKPGHRERLSIKAQETTDARDAEEASTQKVCLHFVFFHHPLDNVCNSVYHRIAPISFQFVFRIICWSPCECLLHLSCCFLGKHLSHLLFADIHLAWTRDFPNNYLSLSVEFDWQWDLSADFVCFVTLCVFLFSKVMKRLIENEIPKHFPFLPRWLETPPPSTFLLAWIASSPDQCL